MKCNRRLSRFLVLATLCVCTCLQIKVFGAEPKRVLVVGATAGFRHPSIEHGEQMIRELAERSGDFAPVFMSADPDYPKLPAFRPPAGGFGGRRGARAFPGFVMDATPEQQTALNDVEEPVSPLSQAQMDAHAALAQAVFSAQPDAADIKAKLEALSAAELALANGRAGALTKLQASPQKLNDDQLQALAGWRRPGPPGGFGGDAPDPALVKVFKKYFSPEALKNYDGIFMVSTTGNLPIPDLDALLKWVADGHAFMGLHAAMDTQLPDSYVEMLGGGARFSGHPGGGQTARKIIRIDKTHPATKDWPDGLSVVDEFYQFRGFDRAKVHSLLDMDFEGESLPVAWVKMYGKGRVFYTSMGHRDDVMLPDIPSLDYGSDKENDNKVSAAYQTHVLNGIRWALGLIGDDSTP